MLDNEQIDTLGEKYQQTLFANIDYDSIFEPDVQALRGELRDVMQRGKLLG